MNVCTFNLKAYTQNNKESVSSVFLCLWSRWWAAWSEVEVTGLVDMVVFGLGIRARLWNVMLEKETSAWTGEGRWLIYIIFKDFNNLQNFSKLWHSSGFGLKYFIEPFF